jgi:GntR family transcriptional regulator
MTVHVDNSEMDRSSPVPLYFQLAEALEQDIISGRLRPGTRLASEPEMCDQFGLSRTTVRQALTRLDQRGLIERRKGQGTFVAGAQPGLWLLQSSRGFFQDEVDRQSRTVTSEIIRAEKSRFPDWACSSLGLAPNSGGAVIERLRSLDGLVALYAVNYVPDWLADAALDITNPNESLYRRLHERTGILAHGGRRSVQAIGSEPWLAPLLQLPEGAPVALIESVAWEESGRIFDCYRAWLRTDRARIEIHAPVPTHEALSETEDLAAS